METPVSTIPVREYTLRKLQMLKDFIQITEQELRDVGELEYDDKGLFQELGKINRLPDYVEGFAEQ